MTSQANSERIELIRNKLQNELSPDSIEIIDESHLHVGHAGAQGGAGHFSVNITSGVFNNLNTVARHRLIYEALNDFIPDQIHALRIKATTPEES